MKPYGALKVVKQHILANPEQLKKDAAQVTSLAFLCAHYGLPVNGKNSTWLKKALIDIGFDVSCYLRSAGKKRSLYEYVTRECPECGKSFVTKSAGKESKRYCSRACSNDDRTYPNANRKRGYQVIHKTCECCSAPFTTHIRRKRFCSRSCVARYSWSRPEFRNRITEHQRGLVDSGQHKGWLTRGKVAPSYPERVFRDILNRHEISFEPERPCGCYLIDFAIELPNNKKIALEIDGKQHLMPSRQVSDTKKTGFLQDNGWNVYRIPWKSIKSREGKAYLNAEVEKFISYYRVMAQSGSASVRGTEGQGFESP